MPDHPADTPRLEVNIAELSLVLEGIDPAGARRHKRYAYVTPHSDS